MTVKRIVMMLVLVVLVASSIIADTNIRFELMHNVNVSKSYSFQFWDPLNQGFQQASAEITNTSGETFFSTLALEFNSDMTFSRIEMSFEYLESIEGPDEDGNVKCLPYTIRIYKPNERDDADLIGTVVANSLVVQGEHVVADTVDLLSGSTTFTFQSISYPERRRIADFLITLSEANAVAGVYSANVRCTYYPEGAGN